MWKVFSFSSSVSRDSVCLNLNRFFHFTYVWRLAKCGYWSLALTNVVCVLWVNLEMYDTLGRISQSTEIHLKLSCQYHQRDLYRDVTLCLLAKTIDSHLGPILALREIDPLSEWVIYVNKIVKLSALKRVLLWSTNKYMHVPPHVSLKLLLMYWPCMLPVQNLIQHVDMIGLI